MEIDRYCYPVPHAQVRRHLDVRPTAHIVEGFHRGERVVSHVRSSRQGCLATAEKHMPEKHTATRRGAP